MKQIVSIAVGLLFMGAAQLFAANAEVRNAAPQEFARLAAQPETVVLDVRTAREIKAGTIKGARHLDFYAEDFQASVGKLDKAKTYLVYCASGVRSAKACNKMLELGFARVVNLSGGIMGWQKAGQPVEK